jgi:predicted adenylyl cyclase CyaB
MKTEIEILFWDIDKEDLRKKLLEVGAVLVKPEFLQKRIVYSFGMQGEIYKWMRVRDEGDKVMINYKLRTLNEHAEEVETEVGDFESIKKILSLLGFEPNSYQENFREVWIFRDVEISIDTWPFLEPVCEIEAENENLINEVSEILNLNKKNSFNKNISSVYKMKYGKHITDLSLDDQKKITFHDQNPF